MHTRFITRLAALALAICAAPLFAQSLTLEIPNGNASAIPVAVVPFATQTGAPGDTSVSDIVGNDLNRCGQFRALPKADIVESPARGSEIKFPTWRLLKQDYIVVGRVVDAEDGALRVEFELHDVAKGSFVFGMKITARANDLRSAAHQIADMIYEKILKIPAAFWTRMAYVTMTGSKGPVGYKYTLTTLGHRYLNEHPDELRPEEALLEPRRAGLLRVRRVQPLADVDRRLALVERVEV